MHSVLIKNKNINALIAKWQNCKPVMLIVACKEEANIDVLIMLFTIK